jgi:hypothetical protein
MKQSILTVPAWILFLAFSAGIVSSEIAALVAASLFNWNMDYGPYPTLRFGLISLVWWSYPYLVGRALYQRSMAPGKHRAILFVIMAAIVNNALSVYLIESYGLRWYIVLITIVVNVFSLVTVFSFPAMALRSIRLKRRARFPEAWNELLKFLLWPFCVWWLQPVLSSIGKTTVHQG